ASSFRERNSMSVQESTRPDCAHPKELLPHLYRGKGRSRRLRLIAAACCREGWDMLEPQPFRAAVGVAEKYADRRAGKKDLAAAWVGLSREWGEYWSGWPAEEDWGNVHEMDLAVIAAGYSDADPTNCSDADFKAYFRSYIAKRAVFYALWPNAETG